MRKKVLAILLAVVMCLAMAAPAFAADSDFMIVNGVLTRYTGAGGDVVIPNGVTSIGKNAFMPAREKMTSVIIPDGVTSIGEDAFWCCTNLASVTIPGSVTSIETNAFYRTCLTSLTIPNGVISIGKRAFGGCSSLTSVSIADSVVSIGELAFWNCPGLTSVTIPDSVTSIGGAAFADCTGLSSVSIPDSVTSIGESAFVHCASLTGIQVASGNQNYVSVDGVLFTHDKTTLLAYPAAKQGAYTVPDSVAVIEDDSFYGCEGLTAITIPASVTSIGYRAFSNSDNIKDVYYGGTETQWNAIQIGELNSSLTEATLHYSGSAPAQPQTLPAALTNDKLTVNGAPVTPAAYKISGANYFKLRDVAAMLNGSLKQFNVGYDSATRSVTITTGEAYKPIGGELGSVPTANATATTSNNTLYINGEKVTDLTVYKINGENYFKARDLGQKLDFNVGWTSERGMFIEGNKSYDPNN